MIPNQDRAQTAVGQLRNGLLIFLPGLLGELASRYAQEAARLCHRHLWQDAQRYG